ncbi:MAG: hypothetical protein WA810_05275 [Maribacter sp.]
MEILNQKSRYVGQLERCCRTLHYIQKHIHSYRYEPSTKSLFETKAYLTGKIGDLVVANESLLTYLKKHNAVLPEQFHRIQSIITETFHLTLAVTEYGDKIRQWA